MLAGYLDRWTAVPGAEVRLHCSGPAGSAEVDLVDLVGAEPERPVAPSLQARLRPRSPGAGSYVDAAGLTIPEAGGLSLWVRPHLSGRPQSVLSLRTPAQRLSLGLTAKGRPVARVEGMAEDAVGTAYCAGGEIPDGVWSLLVVTWTPAVLQLSHRTPDAGMSEASAKLSGALAPGGAGSLRIGAWAESGDSFSGRIALPALFRSDRRGPPPDALCGRDLVRALGADAVAVWDVGADPGSPVVTDISGGNRHARAVNRPLTGLFGPGGRRAGPNAFRTGPEDLDDARWPVTGTLRVPAETGSTVLGVRVRTARDTLVLPLVVRPPHRGPGADVAVVLPTFTYLAYANHRQASDAAHFTDYSAVTTRRIELSATDAFLNEHPEFGPSLYDRRSDGTPAYYSSRLRPVLNHRPDYPWWMTGAPRHFSADLLLLRWLRAAGTAVDVLSDEDVHADGHDLLAGYRVVLTGSHPEYVTAEIRRAVSRYVETGGRLMYLGGNGFYWIAGVDPRYPHSIEVRRRGDGGWWENEPDEHRLTSTGEYGGLWRGHGQAPQRLLGVGFAAQGWGPAPGYRRLPDSYREDASWIFAGVAGGTFGRHGLALGGAAGDEVDRAEPALGTPPGTLVLATSAGSHTRHMLPATEDAAGSNSDDTVRADMTLRRLDGGGAVFAVGSINWITSLACGADNDVARITHNVLARFRSPPEPGEPPAVVRTDETHGLDP